MNFLKLWEKVGEMPGFFFGLFRALVTISLIVVLAFFVALPLTWPQQVVLGFVMLFGAMLLSRFSASHVVTLTLLLMSVFATFRYGYWRISAVADFFRDPLSKWGSVDVFFIFILVASETYSFLILALGYVQTVWPLRRVPVPLPENAEEWPEVDLLIPTYNEPLSLVRHTALAALNIDWPVDKLHVYILDDGKREDFRLFAQQAGIGYITREGNKGAKAGNINNALSQVHSPYVAIFDCDHVPTRSFLQVTMGWFLRDQKLALLQTPHHFYSPDPFERNLDQFRAVPNEEELFYGVVQDGNDFWNATFFCGSCAVLRRTALDQIGGLATETVTEDVHTALRIQMKGWNTAYINIPQAAGLATERLAGHITQRIRWARGMIQVMRTDNPLFCRGLKFAQRVCYFNGMLHFMYALPRLVFLTAPLIYLIFGYSNIPGYWAAILAYALPHLALSNITNSRVQGKHRHSFWNEIYETVLAPYILLPTLLALINPKLGKFNVTPKGGTIDEEYFDVAIAQPFIVLLLFNFVGLIMAFIRFFYLDVAHPGTVIMNAVWVTFNIIILGVATAVARESQQRRQDVRIDLNLPALIRVSDTIVARGETVDVSSGGAAIRLQEPYSQQNGSACRVLFPVAGGVADLPSFQVGFENNLLRVQFEDLSIPEMEQLTKVLYSRADSWLGWNENREADRPLLSLYRIFRLSVHGLAQTARLFFSGKNKEKEEKKAGISATGASILLFVLLLPFAWNATANAQPYGKPSEAESSSHSGGFHASFRLKDAGVSKMIELRGLQSSRTIFFEVADTHVVTQANLHLVYRFSPSLLAQATSLKVLLNGETIATLTMPDKLAGGAGVLDRVIPIPAELLVSNNQLAFQFNGHYALSCEDPQDPSLWSRIDNKSTIELFGSMLPLADELRSLPAPFLTSEVISQPAIPIAFTESPSPRALQAAGVVASYFGVIANHRQVRFPASVGTIPAGNVVVIASRVASLPAGLNIAAVGAPTIALRQNPNDPYGKVLVLTGGNEEQVLMAAQYLALNSKDLQGPTATVSDFTLPAPIQVNAAPRWAQTNAPNQLWSDSTVGAMDSDGSSPINTYLRIPPDLYFGAQGRALLKLSYRYNSTPITPLSKLLIKANDAIVGSVALSPGMSTSKDGSAFIPIAASSLRPYSNTLSFEMNFQCPKRTHCQADFPTDLRGSVLRDSYLDLRGARHFAFMPNLELFANAGYPFTRYADLQQSAVVLPVNPSPKTIELYLSLLGHFGAQTGYPVLRVLVADDNILQQGIDKDLLVIGTANDQPGFDKLASYLPIYMSGDQLRITEPQGLRAQASHYLWKLLHLFENESSETISSSEADALIEGIESPYFSGRSVVLIQGKDVEAYDGFLNAFFQVSQSSAIAKTVSIFRGNQFKSFRFGESSYHIGDLPVWVAMTLWFVQVPWLAPFVVLIACALLATWIRIGLRNRAKERLGL